MYSIFWNVKKIFICIKGTGVYQQNVNQRHRNLPTKPRDKGFLKIQVMFKLGAETFVELVYALCG